MVTMNKIATLQSKPALEANEFSYDKDWTSRLQVESFKLPISNPRHVLHTAIVLATSEAIFYLWQSLGDTPDRPRSPAATVEIVIHHANAQLAASSMTRPHMAALLSALRFIRIRCRMSGIAKCLVSTMGSIR